MMRIYKPLFAVMLGLSSPHWASAQPSAPAPKIVAQPSTKPAEKPSAEGCVHAYNGKSFELQNKLIAFADTFHMALAGYEHNNHFLVTLDRAPASRTRLLFDSSAGDHLELEWDPSKSLRLTRSVSLPRNWDWHVSVAVDPVFSGSASGGSALDYLLVEPAEGRTLKAYELAGDLDANIAPLFERQKTSAKELFSPCVSSRGLRAAAAAESTAADAQIKHAAAAFRSQVDDLLGAATRKKGLSAAAIEKTAPAPSPALSPADEAIQPLMDILRAELSWEDFKKGMLDPSRAEDREVSERAEHYMADGRELKLRAFRSLLAFATSSPLLHSDSGQAKSSRFEIKSIPKSGAIPHADPFAVRIELRRLQATSGDMDGRHTLREAIERMPSSSFGAEELRSLAEPVPGVLGDVLQILAEVAYDRAKSRSLALLTDRLTDLFCHKLTRPSHDLLPAEDQTALLPRTCNVIRNLRVQELGTSAKPLLQALLPDLADQASRTMTYELACRRGSSDPKMVDPICDVRLQLLGKPLTDLLSLVTEVAADPAALNRKRAQLLLQEFAKQFGDRLGVILQPGNASLSPADRTTLVRFACPVELALAIASECAGSVSRCDAPAMLAMVKSPQTYFREDAQVFGRECQSMFGGGNSSGVQAADAALQSMMIRWVTRMMDILLPQKGATVQQQLLATVDLLIDMLDWLPRSDSSHHVPKSLLKLIPELRTLVKAIIQRDAAAAVVSGSQLLSKSILPPDENDWTPADRTTQRLLLRAMQLAGALASYTQSYTGDEQLDAKQATAQREARKKAIESLIDQATERTGRQGDTIVSLGANVGFQLAGFQRDFANPDKPNAPFVGQISLPIGLAVQRLPSAGCTSPRWGWHLQVSPIDVAQFLSYNLDRQMSQVHWANFVMVGAQFGALLHLGKKKESPSPWESVFLGIDARYAPSQTFVDPAALPNATASQGLFRVSAFAAYYVPFFDFN